MLFSIDKNSTTSIYQQLADQIARKIRMGEILPGQKLPTVGELAEQTGAARGTVKHAYEELERRGIINMTRGKGTFVKEQARQQSSTESRAMNAIESFLDEMEALSFSPEEIQMFFQLKLRERMEYDDSVSIIFIDCNPETLVNIVNQISVIPRIEAHKMLLSDAMKAPYFIDDFADVIITTSTHMEQLGSVVKNKDKLVQVVTTPSSSTVARMALISGRSVGILCASETYSHIIHHGMQILEQPCRDAETYLFGSLRDLETFLQYKDILIVPKDFLLFCSQSEGGLIRKAADQGKLLIQYDYQIDGGSFLNVKKRIEAIRNTGIHS